MPRQIMIVFFNKVAKWVCFGMEREREIFWVALEFFFVVFLLGLCVSGAVLLGLENLEN